MASLTDQIEQLALRTKKAATLITMLRKENADLQEEKDALQAEYNRLQADYNFVKTHNAELEESILKYQEQEELITQSIASSLETLDSIDGLDDIDFLENQNAELDAADNYTAGDALNSDTVELNDAMLDGEIKDADDDSKGKVPAGDIPVEEDKTV
ncbi:MAG: ATG16 family protein [Spirochaetia bacterium]|jgi:chromosome segregation ATPase|nr:ATG16 family protein [Spirochaetia bacterium]